MIISFNIGSPTKLLKRPLVASESFAALGQVEYLAFPGLRSLEDLTSVMHVYPSFREARNCENLLNVVSNQDLGKA